MNSAMEGGRAGEIEEQGQRKGQQEGKMEENVNGYAV